MLPLHDDHDDVDPGLPPYPGVVLGRAPAVADVRTLQTRLAELGHAIAVDGEFGPRTEAAVRAEQRTRRIPVDGLVDAATWAALWD